MEALRIARFRTSDTPCRECIQLLIGNGWKQHIGEYDICRQSSKPGQKKCDTCSHARSNTEKRTKVYRLCTPPGRRIQRRYTLFKDEALQGNRVCTQPDSIRGSLTLFRGLPARRSPAPPGEARAAYGKNARGGSEEHPAG